ncbi:MAG: PilN domain-containing protein [Rhodoferax sp.]
MTVLLNNFNGTWLSLKKQIQTNRFLRWWLGELSSMVPTWMRSSELTLDNYVLIPLGQVNASFRKPDVLSPSVAALSLSTGQVMRKIVTVPLAAEENLRQVLAFQAEQHTPFPANKIYFNYVVLAKDFDAGQLTVEFVATPRAATDIAVRTLAEMGIEVRGLFVDELVAKGRLLNLMPMEQGSAPSPWRHGANPWLAGLVVVMAFAALAMPVIIKREAIVQLLPWADKGKKSAEAVNVVRADLDKRVETHNYLLEKRQSTPAVIQVLQELTQTLPDDTWVQVFDLKGQELQIQGETGSSPRLIGLLEQSSLFGDAKLGTSFKGQLAGTERYQLTIQLRSPSKPASAPLPASPTPPSVAGKSP